MLAIDTAITLAAPHWWCDVKVIGKCTKKCLTTSVGSVSYQVGITPGASREGRWAAGSVCLRWLGAGGGARNNDMLGVNHFKVK